MNKEEGLQEGRRCLLEAASQLERDDVQAAHESFRRAVELLDEYGSADERVRAHREWVKALRDRAREDLVLEALRVASELAPRPERDTN